MTLQERIKADLTAAMKAQDSEKKDALRVVIGEFGRLPDKTLSDEAVLKVLKKLIKSEKEVLSRKGDRQSSPYLQLLEAYLPSMAPESEIADWIRVNIDLTSYTNKMQAMGDIMRHFGGRADGNTVKKILQELG
ncbi:MAG: GatB/YqeY domain-containing protein [Desulfobacterales bacterium]